MQHKTVAELAEIARKGGGFEIDAHQYAPADIAAFAPLLSLGARLRIRNAAIWSTADLEAIAQAAPPGVADFVF